MKGRGYWLLAGLFLCVALTGQNWTHYNKANTIQNAPAGDYVKSIVEDSMGNLWMGTENGLSYFNGINWTNYHEAAGKPLQNVSSLLFDQNEILWVGTSDLGLFRFDGWEWKQYSILEGLPSAQVTGLAIDSEGTLWISSAAGLIKMQDEAFESYSPPASFLNLLTTIHIDQNDLIWTATGTPGPQLLSFQNETWESHPLDSSCGQAVASISTDTENKVWLATEAGLCTYANGNFEAESLLSGKDGIAVSCQSNGEIWFVHRGANAGVHKKVNGAWQSFEAGENIPLGEEPLTVLPLSPGACVIGEQDGISFYLNDEWQKISSKDGDGLLADNASGTVNHIQQNEAGELLFGIRNGGLAKFNGVQWESFREEEGLNDIDVLQVEIDDEQNYWLLTSNGIVVYDGDTFELVYESTALNSLAVRGNQVVTCLAANVVQRVNGEWQSQTLPNDQLGIIQQVEIDAQGKIWAAVQNGNYLSLDAAGSWTNSTKATANNPIIQILDDASVVVLTVDGLEHFLDGSWSPLPTNGLSSNNITALESSEDGLWLTDGNHIYELDFTSGFSSIGGIENASIQDLFVDTEGNLWVAHSAGVSHYQPLGEQVWPGDCDENGTVDIYDVLQIALAYNEVGPSRENNASDWFGQSFDHWNYSFPNGSNLAHGDADGNGIIDVEDLAVIDANFQGLHFRSSNLLKTLPLKIKIKVDDLTAGSTVNMELELGNNQQLIQNFYGLSLVINAGAALNLETWDTEFSTDWAFDASTLLFDKTVDLHQHLSIVRSDQMGKTGEGLLAVMSSKLNQTFASLAALEDLIQVREGQIIDADGKAYALDLEIELEMEGAVTGLLEESETADYSVKAFPQPANDHLNLHWTNSSDKELYYSFFDLNGRQIIHEQLPTNAERLNFHLEAGMYILNIANKSEVIFREKIIVSKQ